MLTTSSWKYLQQEDRPTRCPHFQVLAHRDHSMAIPPFTKESRVAKPVMYSRLHRLFGLTVFNHLQVDFL